MSIFQRGALWVTLLNVAAYVFTGSMQSAQIALVLCLIYILLRELFA